MKKFTMIKTLIIVLMILMSFVVVGEVRADGTLYAVDGARGNPASLHILDATTGGVIQTIGPTGFNHLTGIAFHPETCVLYGVTSTLGGGFGDLITIDLDTGAGTLVGNHGAQIPDIDFDSTGTLYGWVRVGGSGGGSDDLYTIDITTGVETLVGFSNFGTFRTGLAFDSFDNLFVKSISVLHSVDASTGLSTGVIGLSFSGLDNALAFDSNDTLYSITRTGVGAVLSTINPGTGLVTFVFGGSNLSRLSAIAFQKCDVSIEFSWDAKLCSNPNAFNCKRTKGVVPVTIFGSADLDVNDIDISSLRLELFDDSLSTGAPISSKPPADRGSPVDVDSTDADCVDDIATQDGFDDLDVGFDAAEVATLIGCLGLNKGDDSPDLIITGTLLDGTPLETIIVQVLTNVSK